MARKSPKIAHEFCRLPDSRGKRLVLGGLLAAACLLQSACVQRRMTVRSNPPGALVYIDNEEIGVTPCSTDFIYYGTRQIRLVKDGYETLTVLQPIPAPIYQYPVIDFVVENFVPYEIRDERTFNFNLSPQVMVPTEELLLRADELRQGSQRERFVPTPPQAQGYLTPPPGYAPPGLPVEAL